MITFAEKLKQLNGFISLGSVEPLLIDLAEKKLSLKFSEEFKNYILLFGVASGAGHEFTGIIDSERLNVVTVTEKMRTKSIVPLNLYVVEEAHIDGIVIWQDEKGAVYQTSPGCEPIKIAASLLEYIS